MVGQSIVKLTPSKHQVITANRDELNLENYDDLRIFFDANRIDAVILAAAKVGGIRSNSLHQHDFLLRNLNIQNSVIEASFKSKVETLVFLGSSCVYPKFATQPIRETSLLSGSLEPTNEGYAIAKIAGIRLCKAIFEETGRNFFSLMPSNLYGPNDNFDFESSHVPAALMRKFHEAKMNRNSEVFVWGTGKPLREFTHVDDIGLACWHMIEQFHGGELINIGTGIDLPISKFAELMAKVVGYQGHILYDSSKPDGTPRKLLDVSKAHSYGWKHKIQLEDGLRQTYSWFVEALAKGEVRGY